MADAPDGCIVETVPLAAILREFVEDYRRRRPSTAGQYRGDERGAGSVEPLGPYAALASDTGLPEMEIRRVRNPKRNPTTELRIADALVASLLTRGANGASPSLFHQPGCPCCGGGALAPMPNPKASLDAQRECCGGSETSMTGGLHTFGFTPGN